MLEKKISIKIEKYIIHNANKIKINSKDITKGDVFLALQGSRVHGSSYIKQALKNGAKYIITSRKLKNFKKKKYLLY